MRAGHHVYSASELARQEFPELTVEKRSAISIARRLQDPLAELVKIDPNPSVSVNISTMLVRKNCLKVLTLLLIQ